MAKSANILLHPRQHYKAEIFTSGLKRHGYKPIIKPNHQPSPDDVLLIWNRGKPKEALAQRYEAAGATVLVTENGYIGKTKAIAKFHHAGAGEWHVGEEDRWSKLGIELKPWRTDGKEILILPQRSIGETGVAMPRDWTQNVLKRIKKATKRPVRVRYHPGMQRDTMPLEDDLDDVWCCVTWASGAGIKAIIHGIPVFHYLTKWIGAPAAKMGYDYEDPWMGDRLPMLKRLAWAQWTLKEIEQGVPFEWLL